EYWGGKQVDACPTVGDSAIYGGLDMDGPDVGRTIDEMVKRKVALTSTLDVMELSSPSRVPFDQRVLDALFPAASAAVAKYYENGKTAKDSVSRLVLQKAMRFERRFAKAG